MLRQILAWYDRALRFAITWLMMLLVIPVSLQIISRYTEIIPRYIWTEEAARFLFIWIIMIGSALAVRDETHFNVDVLPKPKTARGKAVAVLVVDLSMLMMAVMFVWYGVAFAEFGYSQTSELTGINMVFIFGSFLLAGVNWMAFIVARTLDNLPVMIGGERMGPGEVSAIMFGIFAVLIALRVPVSFSLGVACIPIMFMDERLSPIILLTEMNKAYGGFVLLAVPFFILAANLMNSSGITQRLVELSKAMVGHFRGGLGHINVVVSMIFAGISGSSTAEAAGIGSLLIPAMKKQGYDASFTTALIACSAVMGVIIPPSILMVVWGGIMSVSIGALFLSGFLPGVMIGLSQMVCVYIYATKRGYPVYERASFRKFLVTLGRASFALFAPLIVVGGVVGGVATPTEASVLAVLYTLIVGLFVYQSIGLKQLPAVFYETARLASISLFCIGTASAFGFLLAFYRIPKLIMAFLAPYATSVTHVGLIVAGVFLVVGCFIDAIPAMIIFGGLMMPLAEHVHMHPVHFAIIGVVSLAFGLVTPPYGLCLLISCAIGEIEVSECIKDVAIILVPMLGVLLFIILFPQAILFIPRLIMPKFV